ncbi:hypothetical protein L1049_019467 [Liquidambar formosana]|uniref:Uncharacterized protein n=1 Tax=Liquidambar formosana TaxID=63359 RepID=A0AAP0X322_LIQFO
MQEAVFFWLQKLGHKWEKLIWLVEPPTEEEHEEVIERQQSKRPVSIMRRTILAMDTASLKRVREKGWFDGDCGFGLVVYVVGRVFGFLRIKVGGASWALDL